jgi:hypothetical protein
MWMRKKPPPRKPPSTAPDAPPDDLGSQLEDLWTHVMRCERWEQFEDRLDLAVRIARPGPAGGRGRETSGGRS